MFSLLAVLAVLAAAFGAYACAVTSGLRAPAATDFNDGSANADSAPAEAGDQDAGCVLAKWPQRPAEGADGEGTDIVFAIKDIDFGATGKVSSRTGYDLDQKCTCPEAPTCRSASAQEHCDQPGGRDNAMVALSTGVSRPKELDFEPVLRGLLAHGKAGLLLKLGGYNGTPDDRTVKLSFYESAGLEREAGANAKDAANQDPSFTVADRWTVSPSALIGDPAERVSGRTASEAYVTGGVLVASFDAPLVLAGMEMKLRSAALIADVRLDPPRLENGVIVGRWGVAQALEAFGALSTGRTPICRQQVYQGLLASACSIADVRLVRTEDGADMPCNAFSVGLGFVAFEATMGNLLQIPPLADCSDAGSVECR